MPAAVVQPPPAVALNGRYQGEIQAEDQFLKFGPFRFACGEELTEIVLAYQTYGELNADRSNAILICHALSGNQHAAGQMPDHPRSRPWWDDCIGPGKAFDTNRFFVICSNVLGSCSGSSGPAEINPATGRHWGLDFPIVTIADMVEAQVRLVDHLGIGKLLGVAGGSMGGMQVLQWASHHPDRLVSAIPIATTARHSPMQIAFDAVGREAITRDPCWHGGDYYDQVAKPDAGLAVARMVGHITYLSEQSMHEKQFGDRLHRDADSGRTGRDFLKPEFQVESYLLYNGQKFPERFDANAYLYVTKAMDDFDLTQATGRLADAFRQATDVKFLVLSFTSDWLYPSHQSRDLVRALNALGIPVTYVDIDSVWGHDAFLLEPDRMTRILTNYLNGLAAGRA